MFNKVITIITYIFSILFPLFFLPLTSDPYEYNKMFFLVFASLILFLLYAIKLAVDKKTVFRLGSYGIPLIFLSVLYIASLFLQSPNKIIALTSPLSSPATIIAGTLLYFMLINTLDEKKKQLISTILIIVSSLLAVYLILLLAGILPQSAFTPAGSLLVTCIFLFIMLVHLVTKLYPLLFSSEGKDRDKNHHAKEALLPHLEKEMYEAMFGENKHDNPHHKKHDEESAYSEKLLLYLLAFFLIAGSILYCVFFLISSKSVLILPLYFGWVVLLEVMKNPKTLFFGIGPANFQTAFTVGKPMAINATRYWNILFTSSSSYFLNLATEVGIIGAILYWWLCFKSIRLFSRQPSENSHASDSIHKSSIINRKSYIIPLLSALLILIFLPSGMSVFILTIILLALSSEEKPSFEINIDRSKTNLFFSLVIYFCLISPAVIILVTTSYFGFRAYSAEVIFKRAMDATEKNQAKDAYDLQSLAININPHIDRYHLAFSKTTLAIANALTSKKELTDADRQNIPQLVQQAINESRLAVAYSPTNITNWNNLATTYQYLVNFAQGSDEWAIKAHLQKISLDPLNPVNRYALGKFYFDLKRYDEAENKLKEAVSLKNDFARAHYELALLYKEQKNYSEAYKELQATKSLVPAGTEDAQRVDKDILEIQPLLSKNESATPSASPMPQSESTNSALIEIPQTDLTVNELQQLENQNPSPLEVVPSAIPTLVFPTLP